MIEIGLADEGCNCYATYRKDKSPRFPNSEGIFPLKLHPARILRMQKITEASE